MSVEPHLLSECSTVATGEETCRICGKELSSRVGAGIRICERCLLSPSLESTDSNPWDADHERQILPRDTPMLGPYILLEEIGRGGQGVIYRAFRSGTHEVSAVKTVLPQDAASLETLARFRREAAAAQSLDHPHTMPIREVGCSMAGIPYFSMKLAVGGSLHDLGAKYRGRWRQIAELMVKISKAVHHAHQRGILHRDLKPGNILFTEDHEPMVTDFGSAKQFTGSDDLTESCAVLVTPNYASPEQAAGKTRDLTPASDIYSLGAILFELLTGQPPFVGDNPLDILRQVADQSPKRPRRLTPSVPKELDIICMRCLEHQPRDRYFSAKELADDLRGWLQGRKIPDRPIRIRLWKMIKRMPVIYGWCGAGAGLAVAMWITWTLAGQREQPITGMTTVAVAIDVLNEGFSLDAIARQTAGEMKHGLSQSRIFQVQSAGADNLHTLEEGFDPIAYGRVCNAQLVLSGGLRRAGNQLRLVTRLMRCDSGEVVWRHVDRIPADNAPSALRVATKTMISSLRSKWSANPSAFAKASGYSPLPEAQTDFKRATELAARTNQRDLSAAAILFRRASELDSHFASARSMLGFALFALADTYGEADKIPLAMTAAREALILDPDSVQAHRVLASCHFKAARLNEAVEEFWNAVEINPQAAGSCQSLGICLRDMGRPDSAIPWLKRAVKLAPARCSFSGTLGETLSLCGHDEQAEAVFQRAIELDNNQSELQIAFGALRTWQKRFGEARALCEGTRRRFPDSRFGLSLEAWIDLCDGKASSAKLCFERLRAEHSYQQNWEFYGAVNPSSALAYLAKQAGADEQARLLATEALNTDRDLLDSHPHNARILHDLAATCSITGDTEHSLDYLEEAIAAGWVEHRSTKIDPRFTGVASLSRFTKLLAKTSPFEL